MILLFIWLVLGFIGFAFHIEKYIRIDKKKMLITEFFIFFILCCIFGLFIFGFAVNETLKDK